MHANRRFLLGPKQYYLCKADVSCEATWLSCLLAEASRSSRIWLKVTSIVISILPRITSPSHLPGNRVACFSCLLGAASLNQPVRSSTSPWRMISAASLAVFLRGPVHGCVELKIHEAGATRRDATHFASSRPEWARPSHVSPARSTLPFRPCALQKSDRAMSEMPELATRSIRDRLATYQTAQSRMFDTSVRGGGRCRDAHPLP